MKNMDKLTQWVNDEIYEIMRDKTEVDMLYGNSDYLKGKLSALSSVLEKIEELATISTVDKKGFI
jgi:hypothetical protein